MAIDYTKIERMTRPNFLRLDENNIMFIRGLGRMADNDMIFFIVKENDDFKCYKIDGLTHDNGVGKYDYISRDDIDYKLPYWKATQNMTLPIITLGEVYCNTTSKYVCIFLGFGDTICINNSIYEKYEKYLKKEIEDFPENHPDKKEFDKTARIEWQWFVAALNYIHSQKKKLLNYE